MRIIILSSILLPDTQRNGSIGIYLQSYVQIDCVSIWGSGALEILGLFYKYSCCFLNLPKLLPILILPALCFVISTRCVCTFSVIDCARRTGNLLHPSDLHHGDQNFEYLTLQKKDQRFSLRSESLSGCNMTRTNLKDPSLQNVHLS